MPRVVSVGELDLIERVISQHPKGIGISALEEALSHHLPKHLHRRTLQRRLETLLSEKRIITEGESIVLVYKTATGRMKGHAGGYVEGRLISMARFSSP